MIPKLIPAQLQNFLHEDMPDGDITTNVIFSRNERMGVVISAEDEGVLCGIPIVRQWYAFIDPSIRIVIHTQDAVHFMPGRKILTITGSARNIIKGERVALNFLQQLSGTASLTCRYVRETRGTNACIYDTRKTIPGFRELQKYAVRCGGGKNHRISLSDAVLVKDNHLAGIPSIDDLHNAIKHWRLLKVPIEIEADSLEQMMEFMTLDIDVIMLDNFSYRLLKKAVSYIQAHRKNGKPAIEVSGRVQLKQVKRIAQLGVERIAVGLLTHSAPIVNFTMAYGLPCKKAV